MVFILCVKDIRFDNCCLQLIINKLKINYCKVIAVEELKRGKKEFLKNSNFSQRLCVTRNVKRVNNGDVYVLERTFNLFSQTHD